MPIGNDKIRTSITLDKKIMEQIDEYACQAGINRSGAVSVLVMQALDGKKTLLALQQMGLAMEKSN